MANDSEEESERDRDWERRHEYKYTWTKSGERKCNWKLKWVFCARWLKDTTKDVDRLTCASHKALCPAIAIDYKMKFQIQDSELFEIQSIRKRRESEMRKIVEASSVLEIAS